MEPDMFAQHFLPSLLEITDDNIPNVRITLARTVSQFILPIGEFKADWCPDSIVVRKVFETHVNVVCIAPNSPTHSNAVINYAIAICLFQTVLRKSA